MKFEHQYDANSAKVTVEVPKNADIHEVMEAFYGFLVCCTYHPKTIQGGLQELTETLDESLKIDQD
jgi:predicted dienelactone hydrolase